MASFKVGQRVRLIWRSPGANSPNRIGDEGVIVRFIGPMRKVDGVVVDDYAVFWDRTAKETDASSRCLAPLTNPGTERDAAAERFLEKLKQLGREPVTLTEKELLRVSGGQPSGCAPIVGRGGK